MIFRRRYVGKHRPDTARAYAVLWLYRHAVEAWERRVRTELEWAYACRPIKGLKAWSEHAKPSSYTMTEAELEAWQADVFYPHSPK